MATVRGDKSILGAGILGEKAAADAREHTRSARKRSEVLGEAFKKGYLKGGPAMQAREAERARGGDDTIDIPGLSVKSLPDFIQANPSQIEDLVVAELTRRPKPRTEALKLFLPKLDPQDHADLILNIKQALA